MKAGSKDEGLDAAGHHTTPVPTGKMTYRTNPKTGEKVSILGYGWMRLPTIKGGSGRTQENPQQDEIDQRNEYHLDHCISEKIKDFFAQRKVSRTVEP